MNKIDYFFAALIGFLAGVFIIPTAFKLGLRQAGFLMALPLIAPILFVIGFWVGKFLARRLESDVHAEQALGRTGAAGRASPLRGIHLRTPRTPDIPRGR